MQQQSGSTTRPESLPHRATPELADGVQTDASLHWTFLWVSAAVIGLALVLQVQGEERVVIPGLQIPLPGTCTFKRYVGADCPGCGLTRCFISMAHADVQRAWHFNPVGMLFFVIVACQIPLRIVQIRRIRRGRPEIRLGWWGYSILTIVVAGLLIQWGIRMGLQFL
jgi:hypothetical protein